MKTPGNWTLEGFFFGRPQAFRLFCMLKEFIESIGPVQLEVMKTQISFGAGTKFAWVWLPQTWIKKCPDNSITLTFNLNHRLSDERIKTSVEPRPGRWTHHIILEKEADLDDSVKKWIREAYTLACIRRITS